jgi:hypothetical protein
MVSTNEAMNIIREAKGVERSLGSSLYQTVTDTQTGENAMKHILTIGMPAPNTGWGVDDKNAIMTLIIGAVGAGSLFSSGRNFLKSQDGGKDANAKQRNRALVQLVVAAGSFGLLSPAAIPSPFTPVDRT